MTDSAAILLQCGHFLADLPMQVCRDAVLTPRFCRSQARLRWWRVQVVVVVEEEAEDPDG